ncbi:MAG: hypothetical protein J6Z04_06695 [Clostridia bacterium]|nr:hypothetical protein [Clostridia bacterium]
MSNYKSKNPAEAFARSQERHEHLMWRAGINGARYTSPHPDFWISEHYHQKVMEIQAKEGRILPKKYRSRIWKSVSDLFRRKFIKD